MIDVTALGRDLARGYDIHLKQVEEAIFAKQR